MGLFIRPESNNVRGIVSADISLAAYLSGFTYL